jgi:hypothetical protein
MARPRSASPATPPSGSDLHSDIPHVTTRRCPVCEWQGEVIEKGEVDRDCPECHAPTDVVHEHDGKNPHAAALGRLGGLRGGRARAEALSAKRRRDIARKAAHARWHKPK